MRSLWGTLIQYDWYPYKKGNFGHREKMQAGSWCCASKPRSTADCQRTSRRRTGRVVLPALRRNQQTPPCLWASGLQKCENRCLLFKPPSVVLVMAAVGH